MTAPMQIVRPATSLRSLRGLGRLALTIALAMFIVTQSVGADDTPPLPQAPTAVAGPGQFDNLAIITISSEITAVTSKSFARRFQAALDGGADAIVVEIDTPGGALGAVFEITDVIKRSPVPTIAWIRTEAYSGGAIIALACNEIVCATNARMGDAAIIQMIPGIGIASLSDTERAKISVPLISEVVDSAARNGYDEVLINSFLLLGVETWLVEKKSTGRRYFLTEREFRALYGTEPPRVTPIVKEKGVSLEALGPITPIPAPTFAPTIPQTEPSSVGNTAPPAELPEDASPAMRALADITDESAVAAASVSIATPSSRPDFAQASPDDYRFIQYATDGTTLLTLNERELVALGFARYPNMIDTDEELKQYVGATSLARLDQSWSEDFVEFSTQGTSGLIFRGIMIVLFLLGLFVEMAMPGVGVAGVIALLALAGLVVPPLMIDASGWWTIFAILGGIALILVEIFIIPGFGVPGVLGLLALVVGLVGTFAGTGELFPGTGPGGGGRLGWAVATVILGLFGAGVAMYFVSKYTRSIPLARGLTLSSTLASYDTGASVGLLGAMDSAPDAPVDIGATGVTTTSLRPEGEVTIEGEIRDVVSSGGFIDAGTPVRVIEVTGNRVVVEPIPDDAPNNAEEGSA